jgi:lipoate-protein ligase A
MFVLDAALPPHPDQATAVDAALFRAMETARGNETLSFWESRQPAVIVSESATVGAAVHEEACLADGVPIVRRISGGGAVVVGPGCLNYAIVLSLETRPELRDVAYSYRLILDTIVHALSVPGLAIRDVGDVALDGRKVSGNAQRRGRRALLHHGTLLYDFDSRLMERYLRMPVRQPAYRANRSHLAFVANLPLSRDALRRRLADAFCVPKDCSPSTV